MPDAVLISALQHYVYCPRQCALIYIEQVYDENVYTLRGRRLHETVDIPAGAIRSGVRVERALPLWSERLGLRGIADIVEILPDGTPYPVEHKSGKRQARRADEVQLCAQALCLEEMMGVTVPEGALYYHASRRRREVQFDQKLRTAVEQAVASTRLLLGQDKLPRPVSDGRCRSCSLVDACMPGSGG